MMRLPNILQLLCLMSLIACLTSCSNSSETSDLENYVLKLKKQKLVVPQPTSLDETVIKPKAFNYQSEKFREPFSTVDSLDANTKNDNPLANYPLAMLRFVGSLDEESQLSAYVMTPDNMVYQVKVGDIIGNRYGKITDITTKEIKVDEIHVEDGKPNSQIVTLQLKDDI